MSNFKKLCESLELKIKQAYEHGTSLEDAEKLASEFLYAQMQVSNELKILDLDARMRKSGVKAIRAACYLETIRSIEKKPTEAKLTALLDSDNICSLEQSALDKAEVERDALERYYNIFVNAHVHFRNVAKGRFE